MKPTLHIVKVGGNVIDDEARLDSFLHGFARLNGGRMLVHGGGKLATRMAGDLGIPQKMIDGRRVTDADTLRIVTMVYTGEVNKNIVAKLHSMGCPSLGLCGADGDIIRAHRRKHPTIDYGFVGDVDRVDAGRIGSILGTGLSIVVAPITHDGHGQLLNTNADTIAQEVAKAMSAEYEVTLLYCFEKPGVLLDAEDEGSVLSHIGPALLTRLKEEKRIFAGMIPKLDNAMAALQSGVRRVVIGQAEDWDGLVSGTIGTVISLNDP
jgi:acetylglutamate kinase